MSRPKIRLQINIIFKRHIDACILADKNRIELAINYIRLVVRFFIYNSITMKNHHGGNIINSSSSLLKSTPNDSMQIWT